MMNVMSKLKCLEKIQLSRVGDDIIGIINHETDTLKLKNC